MTVTPVETKHTFPEPFYLEIASGDRPYEDSLHNWIHSDARELDHIEVVADCRNLPAMIETPASGIMARHILEHFSHRETVDVLAEWGSLLVPEGWIHIEVPNFAAQCAMLLTDQMKDEEVVTLAYGDQDYEGNYHKTGFTAQTLATSLWKAGFRHVRIQDIGLVLLGDAVWMPDEPAGNEAIWSLQT